MNDGWENKYNTMKAMLISREIKNKILIGVPFMIWFILLLIILKSTQLNEDDVICAYKIGYMDVATSQSTSGFFFTNCSIKSHKILNETRQLVYDEFKSCKR